jgi:hypothetical protein
MRPALARLEYRPLAPLHGREGISALLQGSTRRLARSGGSLCGATDMRFWNIRALPSSHPPHPPTMENRPAGGKTGRAKGLAAGFFVWGGRRVCQKPVDCTPKHPANPHGSKQKCPTGFLQNPRVALFYPRVALFYPRVCFCRFLLPPLSISLFSLVREREREGFAGEGAIHGFFWCLKNHPRVCYAFSSYSVDENSNPGTVSLYKSMTCAFFPEIPRSTGKNAYAPHGGGSQ